MDLKFAISTMVYYHEDINKLLPYLRDWKINNIEIRPNRGHFECQDLALLEQLRKKIEYFDISVKAIHMPVNGVDISSPSEYDRVKSVREVQKVIISAIKLNAGLVVVHPGGECSRSEERRTRIINCVNSLEEIVEFTRQRDIKIALENTLPDRIGDTFSEIQQILEKIPSEYLGVCLDTGHYLLKQKSTERGVLQLDKEPIDWKKKLLHMHVHDNNGEKDLHLLPEEGCFPWTQLLSFLEHIEYQGFLVIEPKEQTQLTDCLNRIKDTFKKLNEMESFLTE